MTISDWQQKAAAKQAEAAAKIPSEWRLPATILQQAAEDEQGVLAIPQGCGILTPKELAITEAADATALRDKLLTQEVTAVEVTTAFCKRAAMAQQLTSCLTETMFPQALARAEELDEHLTRTGKPTGPLHGLPISLKETFNIRGVHSSLGLVAFLDRPEATQNSAPVEILLAAGAVLYVKTDVPQMMMTADSENNEAAVVGRAHSIALRGSLLGIGTDIAGSIRIPALCCGTFGFKPTRPGVTDIAPVAGPLCHSVRDAELFLRVVMEAPVDDLDDMVLGIPWTELAPPTAPNLAIGKAVQKLAAAGHRIVDLSTQIRCIAKASDTSFRYFRIDPDQTQLKQHVFSGGEPHIKSLRYTYNLERGDPEPTLRDMFDLNVTRADVAELMHRVYVENNLDLIIGAGYQNCAVPHDTYGVPVYTVLANLVYYPACIIPFGQANEVADVDFVRDVNYEVENAPCHVQLTGRRLKDERLMQHAKVVESVLANKLA
ncbi:putative general amidase [Aspergillus alliaceus]|uniref:putative general amidase n=1 Tax=Petromyces alliaceus TaxID=209559 RepID=UPI0012A68929|nr:alpha-glucosidase [Aspergillus alliaceus]KAB8229400.1 alpha-glucosidase [Aspergillus alliaceus]